jgi:hypothetical protein
MGGHRLGALVERLGMCGRLDHYQIGEELPLELKLI